jgi:prepilin-type N-terminal cleavage/methylation domain-containing protein
MKTTSKSQKGFTVLELLVVIALITIIIIIVIAVLSPSRQKARDSRRIQDIIQTRNALELFHAQYGYYPSTIYGTTPIAQTDNTNTLVATPIFGRVAEAQTNVYFEPFVTSDDPKTGVESFNTSTTEGVWDYNTRDYSRSISDDSKTGTASFNTGTEGLLDYRQDRVFTSGVSSLNTSGSDSKLSRIAQEDNRGPYIPPSVQKQTISPLQTAGFMSETVYDPLNYEYFYLVLNNGQRYHIGALLEREGEAVLGTDADFNSTGLSAVTTNNPARDGFNGELPRMFDVTNTNLRY